MVSEWSLIMLMYCLIMLIFKPVSCNHDACFLFPAFIILKTYTAVITGMEDQTKPLTLSPLKHSSNNHAQNIFLVMLLIEIVSSAKYTFSNSPSVENISKLINTFSISREH